MPPALQRNPPLPIFGAPVGLRTPSFFLQLLNSILRYPPTQIQLPPGRPEPAALSSGCPCPVRLSLSWSSSPPQSGNRESFDDLPGPPDLHGKSSNSNCLLFVKSETSLVLNRTNLSLKQTPFASNHLLTYPKTLQTRLILRSNPN